MSRMLKREVHWVLNAHRPPKAVFQRAYREARWGGEGTEFHSGPGSTGVAAERYAELINDFIARHDIRSVVDLGCGDFQVAGRFTSDHIDYTGVDVVDELVALNNHRYGSERIRFTALDITQDPLPDGELCLIREVLQHLSNAEISQVLSAVTKYRYVIYSDYQPAPSVAFVPNRDIVHGHDTRLWKHSAVCLDQPPFDRNVQLLLEVESSERLLDAGECIRTFLLEPPEATGSGGQSPAS
jgi:SAM-dependent methyltransferase